MKFLTTETRFEEIKKMPVFMKTATKNRSKRAPQVGIALLIGSNIV